MQGDTNKRDLLKDFVNSDNSVLLGTMSFWEGVDVPGDSLSCVIIDKLPFESPFEPVLKARLKSMQEAGENPFMTYQVPRAVITLRQGSGRLIRSQEDRGVLMICDARLRGTHYGKIFLNSLPPMRRTSDEEKVCGFLSKLHSS
jgi:ATP-dependent DNA helicase DinG